MLLRLLSPSFLFDSTSIFGGIGGVLRRITIFLRELSAVVVVVVVDNIVVIGDDDRRHHRIVVFVVVKG